MMECTIQLCVSWITDGRETRVRDLENTWIYGWVYYENKTRKKVMICSLVQALVWNGKKSLPSPHFADCTCQFTDNTIYCYSMQNHYIRPHKLVTHLYPDTHTSTRTFKFIYQMAVNQVTIAWSWNATYDSLWALVQLRCDKETGGIVDL